MRFCLHHVPSMKIEFANNGACATGAPPRMKKGRMAAGRSAVKDRLDIRAASRTNKVSWMPRKHHRLSHPQGKHVGEILTHAWHPVARLSSFFVLLGGNP